MFMVARLADAAATIDGDQRRDQDGARTGRVATTSVTTATSAAVTAAVNRMLASSPSSRQKWRPMTAASRATTIQAVTGRSSRGRQEARGKSAQAPPLCRECPANQWFDPSCALTLNRHPTCHRPAQRAMNRQ